VATDPSPHLRASDKNPLFFFLETGRCARGCIGDGTWYAAMGTIAHQATSCMMVGDPRFFEHGPNLSHLVLADCAKSHDTTTADLLDRTEVSWARWSVWPNLVMDLAVFEFTTVTEPHLATATGVWKDIMGVSDRQKTATQIKGFIANGKHCVLANFDARLPILDSDHQNRYPRTQGCHLFCAV
jgi:hypothetical protein